VAELALDDVDRQTFARHLHGVRVPELMRSEPPPPAGAPSELAELGPYGAR